jgi:hypothetical protein
MGGTAVPNSLTLFPMDEVLQPQLIPMEVNLEGYPLFTRQKVTDDRVIEIRQVIGTNDGQTLKQVWRAAASADNTLPGPFDEDVFVGVMALVRLRGGMPADGRIRFSIYELLKVMGRSKRGGWAKKIRESLDRIGSTTYYTENCFYVVETESLESYRFPLWTIHFSRAKSRDGRAAEHHTLKFDDVIIRSYNAGYLKLLDTDLYFRLSRQRSPLAKALYRLIDQKRGEALSWSMGVVHLRDLLAMSKSYGAPSKIWEVLQPAIRALKREKFLESAVLHKDTARFKVRADFARDWLPDTSRPPATLREEAVAALVERGVTVGRARSLVDEYGPEKAFHVLEVLGVNGALEGVRNKGGYVARVVERGDAEELAEQARLAALSKERAASREAAQREPTLEEDAPDAGPDAVAHRETAAPHEPDPVAQGVWEAILHETAREIDETSLRVWFENIVATGYEHGTLTIAAPTPFAKEYIESRFAEALARALARREGERSHFVVRVA